MSGPLEPFLLAWLGAWTVGGGFAMWTVWRIVRPAVPQSIVLDYQSFDFDSGIIPLDLVALQSRTMTDRRGYASLGKKRQKFHVTRDEHPVFVLERVGDTQRLRFDRGIQRVEIGETLSEPEREWLYGVLRSWQEGKLS